MRSIKFRGKTDKGKWVFGFYYEECGNAYIIEDRQQETLLNRNITHKVDPDTIGQFTGLTDQNENKIYEGDIINIIDQDEVLVGHGVVQWLDDWGLWYVDGDGHANDGLFDINYNEYLEVIGNTHDNPELI